ncbi:hypothetical protein LVJ94_51895 [Pendulispora rubella]|uniref:Secreted protein n=1 Tax=Pendulispora rubella TaxID=2741070 RepID=A0ABZ2L3G4_9BACT
MRWLVRTLAACAVVPFLACSDSEPAPAPPPEPVDIAPFAEGDWHAGVALRRVGTAYQEKVQRLVALPSGGVAVVRFSKAARNQLDATSIVETFDSAGARLASLAVPEKTAVVDLTVHPSGELTLVEARMGEKWGYGQVWLRRLAPDLRVLAEAPLRDRPSEHERLLYRFARQPNGGLEVIDKVETMTVPEDGIVPTWYGAWHNGHFLLAPQGEDIVLSAWSYGTKVYALGADLGVRWSRQVMPEHSWMTTGSPSEGLVVDRAGGVTVAVPIDAETVQAYDRHFGRAPVVWSGSKFQTLVTRIAPDGRESTARIFGHTENGHWSAAGIGVHGDDVILCGSLRMGDKFKEPNHTMEWDLGWFRGNMTDGTVEAHVIDLQRDDLANACKVDADGNIVFAGVNDFVQVDTNSWVQFGQAFLYAIDSGGNEISRHILRGPRHTGIEAFDGNVQGKVYFGGSYDGPITHTPDTEWAYKAMLGVVSIR